jgi:hypothetical protein
VKTHAYYTFLLTFDVLVFIANQMLQQYRRSLHRALPALSLKNQSGEGVSPKVLALNVRWLVIICVFRVIVLHLNAFSKGFRFVLLAIDLQQVFCMFLFGDQFEYDLSSRW